MHRTRLLAASVIGAIVVLLIGASLQSPAVAGASRPDPTKGGAVKQARPAADQRGTAKARAALQARLAPFPGYSVEFSDLFTDPANAQVGGSVTCSSGKTAVGGGALISSSSLSENINGSFPANKAAWGVYINNASSTAGTFRVYVVCLKKVAKYKVVSLSAPNNSGAQTQVSVPCPSGRVVLGGGGVGASTSTLQNLNSSFPISASTWRADINNGAGFNSSGTTYAVCGKAPTGYTVLAGPNVTNNANSQTPASVACPSGTAPLGGGALSGSGSTSVNLNSTLPSGSGWSNYENNATAGATTLTPYVVCGQVTT